MIKNWRERIGVFTTSLFGWRFQYPIPQGAVTINKTSNDFLFLNETIEVLLTPKVTVETMALTEWSEIRLNGSRFTQV